MATITTATSRITATTAPSSPLANGHFNGMSSNGGGGGRTTRIVDDEKYKKRRYQKRKEQQRNILLLIFVTACVLTYTVRTLSSPSSSSSSNDDDKKASAEQAERYRKLRQVHEQNYRKDMKQQQIGRRTRGDKMDRNLQQNDGEEEGASGGGFLHNVFGGSGNKHQDDVVAKLNQQLKDLDDAIVNNHKGKIRWIRPQLIISLDRYNPNPLLESPEKHRKKNAKLKRGGNGGGGGGLSSIFSLGGVDTGINRDEFFKVKRRTQPKMKWESEPEANELNDKPPKVDYTKHNYKYPKVEYDVPEVPGSYPKLVPLQELMDRWPQDDLDNPPNPYEEVLMHFDYSNPKELAAAHRYRDAKLPFKMYNVPEVDAATEKWTDEYVSINFDSNGAASRPNFGGGVTSFLKSASTSTQGHPPPANGGCQESKNNFFAFFTASQWGVEDMGIPPTRNNDWTFKKWARHARYADAVGLHPEQPHFYWQAGVDRDERNQPKDQWTFISRDLPSFSSPTKTFFVFNPDEQKGIQCRFGERGVTAATHFDAGRNMIAMITGAKRYVLSPPNQCSKLGIVTGRGNAIFRHSLLNFGHLNYVHEKDVLHDPENPISTEELDWLHRSGEALALDTVLKAGEVLYLPSHWFHYITSVQKSAQCNVRSGVDIEGDEIFGGKIDVTAKCLPFD